MVERLAELEPAAWRLAKALGAVIREDCSRRRITIDQLSKAARVDVQKLLVIETGQTTDVEAGEFCRIAAALGRTPDELMTLARLREKRMAVQ